MKLDRIKSKGICAVLVPCLLFSTLTLGGCEDVETENSDVPSSLTLDNETENVEEINVEEINVEEINVEEIKEGDVKIFAPGEHMFAKQQYNGDQIPQYDGYEVFDTEVDAYYRKDLIVIYVNIVEVEAVASEGKLSYNNSFNTPGIPTQKEQENQKVYTK